MATVAAAAEWVGRAEDVPGDGTCMFHAVARQVGARDGYALRTLVADYTAAHADAPLHGTPIRSWIQWEVGTSAEEYVRRMRGRMWGGALDLTLLASALRVPIFVYIPDGRAQCRRVTAVRPDTSLPASAAATSAVRDPLPPYVCLLYVGRSHYMCLHAVSVGNDERN